MRYDNGIRKEYQTGYGVMVYFMARVHIFTWWEVDIGWICVFERPSFSLWYLPPMKSKEYSPSRYHGFFMVAGSWSCVWEYGVDMFDQGGMEEMSELLF